MVPLQLSKKPIALRPSQPASTHVLSHLSIRSALLQQQNQLSKLATLEQQLQNIYKILHAKEEQAKEIHLDYGKKILMLNLELEHQRQITGRYDEEFRKYERFRADLQRFYEEKFEAVEREITDRLEAEVRVERERVNMDLRELADNYVTKMGLMAQNNREKEVEYIHNVEEINNYRYKFALLEAKMVEKQRIISVLEAKNVTLASSLQSTEIQLKAAATKLKQLQPQLMAKNSKLYEQLQQSSKIKQQLFEQLQSLKNQFGLTNLQKQDAIRENMKLKDDLELALRRFNKIQKDFDDLTNQINRKTEKNKDEYDKNRGVGSARDKTQRDRQKQRTKQGQREREKDKENITGLTIEIQRLNDNIKFLQEQIHNKDAQIQQLESEAERLKRFGRADMQNQSQRLKSVVEKYETNLKNIQQQCKLKDAKITSLGLKLTNLQQEHLQKVKALTQKIEKFGAMGYKEEGELQQLIKKIEAKYLKQLSSQAKQIQTLKENEASTMDMIANQAKKRKDLQEQLQKLKSSKKK